MVTVQIFFNMRNLSPEQFKQRGPARRQASHKRFEGE
jgi:hypothetical protein